MNSRNPKDTLLKWVECFNTRDAETLAELYHEDAVNLQLAVGQPLRGRDAIREDARAFFKSIPDNHTKLENMLVDGDKVAIEWSGFGTFAPTGKTFTFNGCGFFHVIDGKIKTQQGYWDMMTFLRNTGLPIE